MPYFELFAPAFPVTRQMDIDRPPHLFHKIATPNLCVA
jgi:hypothetical protein